MVRVMEVVVDKTQWSDLSMRNRLVIKAGVAAAIMGIVMLIDLKRRPADQIRGPKWLWTPMAFVDFLAADPVLRLRAAETNYLSVARPSLLRPRLHHAPHPDAPEGPR